LQALSGDSGPSVSRFGENREASGELFKQAGGADGRPRPPAKRRWVQRGGPRPSPTRPPAAAQDDSDSLPAVVWNLDEFVERRMTPRERDDFTRLVAARRGAAPSRYGSLGPRARLRKVLADFYTPPEVARFLAELESRAASGRPLVRRELRTPPPETKRRPGVGPAGLRRRYGRRRR
jgi:hypothetical protein